MKGVSKTAWILIAFVLALAVAGFFGYWFYITSGGVGGFMSEEQCKMTHMTACKDYESKGFPTEMDGVRIYCKNEIPAECCSGETDGFHTFDDLSIGTWWNCIAPGCRQKYDIKIDTQVDCGA